MRLYIYIVCVVFTFISCGRETSENLVFIGGEIINKNTDYVILYDAKEVIDTIRLDGRNRFLYKFEKDFKPGFYTFRHGAEVQMVLLEPGDSLMFRLNTYDFDESLVYTGKGAKKNNYLINDFLEREIEEKEIFKYCQLDPKVFERHLDSIKAEKNIKLKAFEVKYTPSELFSKIAQANIDYAYYSSKEIYPFVHYGYDKKSIMESLPEDFYAYRKVINYNDEFFKHNFNYITFLRSSFNNIGLGLHLEHSKKDKFKWMDLCYNLCRLEAIDSLVINPDIKNELLYHYGISFLAKNKNLEHNDIVLKSLLAKGTDKKKNDKIVSYNASVNRLKTGEKFPEVKVLNLENNSVSINNVFNKPSVVYFWSHMYKDFFDNSHKRAKELRKKYPEVDFISVNIDCYSTDRWQSTLKKKNCSPQNEYMFENSEQSIEQLAIYPLTKVILVDKESTIVNGHSNMFESSFEEELLAMLNR
ncbi:hypothetical protein H7U19_15025 [Hyunsoonleella sp. SJ7]|uniref:Thioredoxin domain-containing protein n=1 Tax=Hyunsoonleella aquatilis TaxID=2762758 RepID=A0A923HBY5_9FLAO|nr:hypothetical protein [Hyunsoonleella aquatilis]MBC3759724.1 hypothetical protein [Hyunsoonleella aquatilis]